MQTYDLELQEALFLENHRLAVIYCDLTGAAAEHARAVWRAHCDYMSNTLGTPRLPCPGKRRPNRAPVQIASQGTYVPPEVRTHKREKRASLVVDHAKAHRRSDDVQETLAKHARICALYRGGLSYEAICKELHVDSRTVRAALVAGGETIRPQGHIGSASDRDIQEKVFAGWSTRRICEELHCCPKRVKRLRGISQGVVAV